MFLYVAGQDRRRSTTALILRRHVGRVAIPLTIATCKARFTTGISQTHHNNSRQLSQ